MKNGTQIVQVKVHNDGFELTQVSDPKSTKRQWSRSWLVEFGATLPRRRGGAGDAVVSIDAARFNPGDDPRVRMRSGGSLLLSTLIYSFDLRGCLLSCAKPLGATVVASQIAPLTRDGQVALALEPVTEEPAASTDPLAGCVRDVDLAERCGLKKPRDIRASVRKAAADGDLEIRGVHGAAAAGAAELPLVWAVIESCQAGARNALQDVTVYYLTDAAAKVMVQRLGTPKARKVQADFRQRNAAPPPPANDVVAIATAVASALAPMFEASDRRFMLMMDRFAPAANHVAPQLPARAVVVEAPPNGFRLTQKDCAENSGLPSDGPGSNIIGAWARDQGWYGCAPYSAWAQSAFNGRKHEQGSVVYAPCFLSAIAPAAMAAQREMQACGYGVVGGRLSAFPGGVSCTKEVCAERMRLAGVSAMQKAG